MPEYNWLLGSLSEYWSQWISNASISTFKEKGYYSQLISPSFKFISLNTQYGDQINFYHLVETNPDPGNQLSWFQDQLIDARNKNQKVLGFFFFFFFFFLQFFFLKKIFINLFFQWLGKFFFDIYNLIIFYFSFFSHIPCSFNPSSSFNALDAFCIPYINISSNFSDVIVAHIFGHTVYFIFLLFFAFC